MKGWGGTFTETHLSEIRLAYEFASYSRDSILIYDRDAIAFRRELERILGCEMTLDDARAMAHYLGKRGMLPGKVRRTPEKRRLYTSDELAQIRQMYCRYGVPADRICIQARHAQALCHELSMILGKICEPDDVRDTMLYLRRKGLLGPLHEDAPLLFEV